jgi:hypothetical protein
VAIEPNLKKCSFCGEESSIGCEVMDQDPPRKMCKECMVNCVQDMLSAGYFEMTTSERSRIKGFIMRDEVETVMCQIIDKQPNGYSVMIAEKEESGFLVSSSQFEKGEKLRAQIVCRDKGRLLLLASQGGREGGVGDS